MRPPLALLCPITKETSPITTPLHGELPCSSPLKMQLEAIKAGWIHFQPKRVDGRRSHLWPQLEKWAYVICLQSSLEKVYNKLQPSPWEREDRCSCRKSETEKQQGYSALKFDLMQFYQNQTGFQKQELQNEKKFTMKWVLLSVWLLHLQQVLLLFVFFLYLGRGKKIDAHLHNSKII